MLGLDVMRIGKLEIAQALYDFVAVEALPGTGVHIDEFWSAFEAVVVDLGPRNAALLARRDELQAQIDDWHRAARADGRGHDPETYADFLRDIDYLRYMDGSVTANTANVDPEIAEIAGPQLVVPLDNARYALNAANARWGSLYDALYGTDAIDEAEGCAQGTGYNPIRGDKVVAAGRGFLDRHFALDSSAHAWVTDYRVADAVLRARSGDGTASTLLRPEQLTGYQGEPEAPTSILLRKNGLHCEICIDRGHPVGRRDHAGVYDIRLESATTVIMDYEDSVSAVDTEDKVANYRNWLGLMRGTLATSFLRDDGTTVSRSLNPDRHFTSPSGSPLTLSGRSLMLVRNVGPHLTTDMVTIDGEPIHETMIDAMITALCALHDLRGHGRIDGRPARNSRAGSVYIVKPKMHGPDEVAAACQLFSRVEDALGLVSNTLKMGIMDEERRTSLGLKECIAHARDRVVFINTGFLDRTGDEIHTDMEAGPMIPKAEMRAATWLGAYENSNVDTGLACGLRGRAQIGKGMWTMPTEMAAMVKAKIQHPIAGASTAWVPSPTAATLHAMHYFLVDVADRQHDLAGRTPARLASLIDIPVLDAGRELGSGEIQRELDNNVQGILGYVVRWVGQGVGCSTVLDVNDIGLMEDLATLRISSQHIANWLHHGLIADEQARETLRRMANLVDQQNSEDPHYEPMAPDYDSSIPFQAAMELVFSARSEPNGYTERILRSHRRAVKARSVR